MLFIISILTAVLLSAAWYHAIMSEDVVSEPDLLRELQLVHEAELLEWDRQFERETGKPAVSQLIEGVHYRTVPGLKDAFDHTYVRNNSALQGNSPAELGQMFGQQLTQAQQQHLSATQQAFGWSTQAQQQRQLSGTLQDQYLHFLTGDSFGKPQ
jgi:hypothetical protein